MYSIGVDIGGTNLKIGLFQEDNLVQKNIVPTDKDNVVQQLLALIEECMTDNNVDLASLEKIAIGCPGLVSRGIVLSSANLNLNNCNLKKIVKGKFKCRVAVLNDVNLSAISEKNVGAGRGVNNFVMLTVGTGIGGSIFINGELYEGNGAGEFGHTIFKRDGRPCPCGRKGCAERYLSLIALSQFAKDCLQNSSSILANDDMIKASDIEKAYLEGDSVAQKIVEKYSQDFSEYLLDICNVLRPDKILIGGGLSFAPAIIDKIAKLCKKKGFGYPNSQKVDIEIAKLGNDAGIYGVLFAK